MKSAKDKLEQVIQRDLLFDFKKRIFIALFFVGIFLILAICNIFISSQLINFLMVLVGGVGAITIYFFAIRIKQVQKEYEQAGITLFNDVEHKYQNQ